jgi:hypothetical protein
MTTPRPEKLPSPTYTPAVVAVAIMLIAWGAVTTLALVMLGVLLLIVGVWGWMAEIRREH